MYYYVFTHLSVFIALSYFNHQTVAYIITLWRCPSLRL